MGKTILSSPLAALLARVLLTLPFWANGLMKLLDFPGGVAEMEHFGLAPAALFNGLTICVHLAGSALIIARRWTGLGVAALAAFTLLTIPIAHRFWALSGQPAVIARYVAEEHLGMLGGLLLVSINAARGPRSDP